MPLEEELFSNLLQHKASFLKFLEFQYSKRCWDYKDLDFVKDLLSSYLGFLNSKPDFAYSDYSDSVYNFMVKLALALPLIRKHFIFSIRKIYRTLGNKGRPSPSFYDYIKSFPSYIKFESFDNEFFREMVYFEIKKLFDIIKKETKITLEIKEFMNNVSSLLDRILDTIDRSNSMKFLFMEEFSPSRLSYVGLVILFFSLESIPSLSGRYTFRYLKKFFNFGDKYLREYFNHIDNIVSHLDIDSSTQRTFDSFNEYLKDFGLNLVEILSKIGDLKKFSDFNPTNVLDYFNELSSQFLNYFDSFNIKDSYYHSAAFLYLYLMFKKSKFVYENQFIECLNSDHKNIEIKHFYSLVKQYVQNIIEFDIDNYLGHVKNFIKRYVSIILEKFSKFSETFSADLISDSFELCYESIENGFSPLNFVENTPVESSYYFPQQMAVTSIFVIARYSKPFSENPTLLYDVIKDSLKGDFLKDLPFSLGYLLELRHNRFFNSIKSNLDRFSYSEYQHKDFVSAFQNSDHKESLFILDLYKLSSYKDPNIFCKDLSLYDGFPRSIIHNLIDQNACFTYDSTFSKIKKFINDKINNNKDKNYLLTSLTNLRIIRQNFKDFILEKLHNSFFVKDVFTIPKDFNLEVYNKTLNLSSNYLKSLIGRYFNIAKYVFSKTRLLPRYDIAFVLESKFSVGQGAIYRNVKELVDYYGKMGYLDIKERFGDSDLRVRYVPPQLNLTHCHTSFSDVIAYLNYIWKLHLNHNNSLPKNILNKTDSPYSARVSSFGKTLTNLTNSVESQRKLKHSFIKQLLKNSSLSVYFFKDLDSDSSDPLETLIYKICYLCLNDHYSKNDICKTTGSAGHNIVLPNILNNIQIDSAIEIPIWKEINSGKGVLTGHIDLLLMTEFSGGPTLVISDYKPNEVPYYSLMNVNSCFLNSIGQVATYGLLANSQFSGLNIICLTFSKHGAWVYDPKILYNEIRSFLDSLNFPDVKREWEKYVFFLSR